MTSPSRDGWARGLWRRLRRIARKSSAVLLGHFMGSRLFSRRTALGPGGPKQVLVIRIDERVGNVLLTTPLFSALRSALPSARVDVLVAASKARLVEDGVHVIPFARKHFFVRPWSFMGLLFALRRARYDVVIDASHWHEFSASSAMLLAWTGAPMRIAHDRGPAHLYANVLVPQPQGGSEVKAKLRLLAPLSIDAAGAEISTPLGRAGPARARMEDWLRAEGLFEKTRVALLPGARKLDHRADPELFVQIGREARALGAEVLVLWGPGEEALARRVADEADGRLAPPTDLDELAAMLRLSAAAVANDTGPMHLAVACGAPTIALFSQMDHERWGHDQPRNAVVPLTGHTREEVLLRVKTHLVKVLGIAPTGH